MKGGSTNLLEERTARLTVLIDPRKKRVFEQVCLADDVTPSQVVRKLIREYIERRLGRAWNAGEVDVPRASPASQRPRGRRRVSR